MSWSSVMASGLKSLLLSNDIDSLSYSQYYSGRFSLSFYNGSISVGRQNWSPYVLWENTTSQMTSLASRGRYKTHWAPKTESIHRNRVKPSNLLLCTFVFLFSKCFIFVPKPVEAQTRAQFPFVFFCCFLECAVFTPKLGGCGFKSMIGSYQKLINRTQSFPVWHWVLKG